VVLNKTLEWGTTVAVDVDNYMGVYLPIQICEVASDCVVTRPKSERWKVTSASPCFRYPPRDIKLNQEPRSTTKLA